MSILIKRFLVLAMALPFGLLSMCSKGADIAGEYFNQVAEDFHETPPAQELYDVVLPILKETLSQDDTEFPITYIYPENYRNVIQVTGDELIVERVFDVDTTWEESESKYEYYFDEKLLKTI